MAYSVREEIRQSYYLKPIQPSIGQIESYIKKIGQQCTDISVLLPKQEIIENAESHPENIELKYSLDSLGLATMIYRVANIFQIDAWVFTALIHQESSFRCNVQSPTGALGLTQITIWAIREIHQQMGYGNSDASRESKDYFNSIFNELANNGKNKLNNPELKTNYFIKLPDNFNTESKMKKYMALPHFSLIYGAGYLKVVLAVARRKGNTDEAMFKEALRNYNGDTNIHPKHPGTQVRDVYKQQVIDKSDSFYSMFA